MALFFAGVVAGFLGCLIVFAAISCVVVGARGERSDG